MALHLWQPAHGGLGRSQQRRHVHARALQQGLGALVLAQHGQQHMGGLNEGVVVSQRQRLGFAQRFLKFGGEFVKSHEFLQLLIN